MTNQHIITQERRALGTDEVMRLLNYRSRQSFWQAVHQQGVPHIRINQRKIVFPEIELNHWLERRMIGGRAS